MLKASSPGVEMIKVRISSNRIESLDGLRGLAILLVLFFDLFYYLPGSNYGWVGIDLFFVLSGFLITGILMDTVGEPGYWRNFYARRILRIFPLYYLSLILIILTAWQLRPYYDDQQLHFSVLWQSQAWLWFYALNWWEYLMEESFPARYVAHFWTLGVEGQFYLVWPLLVNIFRGKSLLILILIVILGALTSRYLLFYLGDGIPYPEVYVATFSRMDSIGVGSLIAYAFRHNTNYTIALRNYNTVFFLVSLAAILYMGFSDSFNSGSKEFAKFGYTANAMLFGSLLLFTLDTRNPLSKCLNTKILRFFGKYSFAIYVFHWPVFNFLFFNLQNFMGFSSYTLISQLIASLIVLLITLGLSLMSWYYIEKRVLQHKKSFSYRINSNPTKK